MTMAEFLVVWIVLCVSVLASCIVFLLGVHFWTPRDTRKDGDHG